MVNFIEKGFRMLDQAFAEVYSKFKLHFYKKVFSRFEGREASLTTVESFCMEIIQALDGPTVNEFASFVQISPPNAAYKVNSLIQKGYLKKVRSKEDRREYHLRTTQKYFDYYNISYGYLSIVMERIKQRFSEDEVEKLEQILLIISNELMPEIELPLQRALPRPMED
jgi:DNA-binding MarR family transcriptional regulator